jgi:hypothetical protein
MLYTKTGSGQTEVGDERHRLDDRQRELLSLCDGKRTFSDLVQIFPPTTLGADLEHLCNLGLLRSERVRRTVRRASVDAEQAAQHYREAVTLATHMAAELGFAGRVRAQFQIERADSLEQIVQLAAALYDELSRREKATRQMAAGLHKLRKLTLS